MTPTGGCVGCEGRPLNLRESVGMKWYSRGASIALAVGLVVGSAALAAGSSPAVNVKWKEGKVFPSTATRFDGATVGSKVYFLGFRVDDAGTTDGSVWYYDLKKDKYFDTKVDM